MKILKLFFLTLLFFSTQFLRAQYTFIAVVRDSTTKEPLIGASVVVKGTTSGNSADIYGKVKLNFNKIGIFEIESDFIGYRKKIIKIEIPQKDTSFTIF